MRRVLSKVLPITFKSCPKFLLKACTRSISWYNKLARSNSRILRSASLGILGAIAFLSILGVFHLIDPYPLRNWFYLKLTLDVMGLTGVLTYLLMVSILPLFSPLSLIIVTGSAAFGPVEGCILSYLGCIINANIAYILVKALSIEERWGDNSRGKKIKKAMQQHGYIVVMGLHLTTIVPFTLINALAACSGISWKKFMKATCIGLLPGTVLYSFMGNKLILEMVSPRVYFAGVFVMVFLLAVIGMRKKVARRAIARSGQSL